ncbi:type VI secretion system baseplate subunit TssE [Acanthopleuribacter pedis]|uniref:Type VI secretion system baseplate subunit TssE n=1 Tax=Acanthopleuribacter pedis TaxID=442870 RepID=A0A8J7QIT4_9BACT|nr:type VI secretion system baseplate subunit TssE [Acanthopleuribacter pedis]MBO1321080.1 type VI secretion system baseplate subunit TssE [Acanthopleuribacter pedis]
MNELRPKPGAPVPLLARLIDLDREQLREAQPLRTLDRDGLLASLKEEIDGLLATRVPMGARAWLAQPKTVHNFGLPDFSDLSPQNPNHRDLVKMVIADAVHHFEPRLRDPEVTVQPRKGPPGRFQVMLTGQMLLADLVEPISFPCILS